ncbi:hypothetical protein RFI_26954, partial [Reticulomyxa filosa]
TWDDMLVFRNIDISLLEHIAISLWDKHGCKDKKIAQGLIKCKKIHTNQINTHIVDLTGDDRRLSGVVVVNTIFLPVSSRASDLNNKQQQLLPKKLNTSTALLPPPSPPVIIFNCKKKKNPLLLWLTPNLYTDNCVCFLFGFHFVTKKKMRYDLLYEMLLTLFFFSFLLFEKSYNSFDVVHI